MITPEAATIALTCLQQPLFWGFIALIKPQSQCPHEPRCQLTG
jgi:hypothetical protein